MATIQRRERAGSKDVWCVRIRRAGYPLVSKTFPSENEARTFAASIEADMEGRGLPAQATMVQLIDRYKPHAPGNAVVCLTYGREHVGNLKLGAVTPRLVKSHRDHLLGAPTRSHGHKRTRPRSSATVRKYLFTLSACFRFAEEELGWQVLNPVRAVKLPKPGRHRVRWLTEDERTALIAACAASDSATLSAAVALSLSTGLRKGELHALTWRDVDLKGGVATVRGSKNGDARAVALVPEVVEALRTLPAVAPDDRLFPHDMAHTFVRAVAKAGLGSFRWHDMRHDCATKMVAAGISSRTVMAVLGHRTTAMVTVYQHVADETARKAVLEVFG